MESSIEVKETSGAKSNKHEHRTKTQTFRDVKPLCEFVTEKNEAVEKQSEGIEDWIRKIVIEIANLGEVSKISGQLIADDSEVELLKLQAMFVKVPLPETKKEAKGESLLTKLLGKVRDCRSQL